MNREEIFEKVCKVVREAQERDFGEVIPANIMIYDIVDWYIEEIQKEKIKLLEDTCNELVADCICKIPEQEGCDICYIFKTLSELQKD